MRQALASVAALLLGTAILLAGQGLQGILLPVRATLENFSSQAIGFFGGAYFLGFTLGCWLGVPMIRRAGHVRVFAAMTALASAAPLLHGLWINLGSWVALRLISGFCFAVLYVVIESWLNERASNEDRGVVFSAYILINMTVLAAGQQLLLLSDPLGLQLFALTSVLVSLAALPVLLSIQAVPREVERSQLDFRALYRNSPVGVVGTLTAGLNAGTFWALAAVFVAAYSDDPSKTAWFMTAVILGGAVGQWPLGWWSDRFDRRKVLVAMCVAGAATAGAIGWFAPSASFGTLLWLGGLWGALIFPTYSISVAHANDWADPETFVQVSAGLLLVYGIGAVIGPLAAPGFMNALGAPGMFWFSAVTYLALLAYTLRRINRREAVDEAQTGEFSDALTSARTLSQVYEGEMEAEHEGRG
ncbi:MAG: MFS transporter [Xanthomonadales bacterium]|jgi:MFS family permease|nr:MFS transporter [Xanthomonadales bacterium]